MNAFFSRILAFFMSIIALFTGASANNITLKIKDEVTTESETIVYEMSNQGIVSVWSDEYFTLEINCDGEWIPVPQVGAVSDVAWKVGSFTPVARTINLVEMFGHTLDAGEYRLTKTYTPEFGKSDGENSCSVIFTVTEAN